MKGREEEFLQVFEEVLKNYDFSPIIASAIRFFLRNPYESLAIINKEGKVEFIDRGSEKLFALSEGDGRGHDIRDFVPESDLPRVLETGIPFIGKVVNVKGFRRIGSTYPLIRNGEVIGAIGRIFFRSFEEVERINSEMGRLKNEVKTLRERQQSEHHALYAFENIFGISPAINEAIDMAKKIATVETDVLLSGESGTGKELFAQAIHNFNNPKRPFVRVNSPAIPFDLAESELFGYEMGAFSGAKPTGKQGKFELAHNGTIFLDEVSSLPLSIQAKILMVLQEREIEKLGGTRIKKVRFRLIAATNVNLKKLVADGKFREDLYYRIAKATIRIPPLRERTKDIPFYVDHFLKSINKQFGTRFVRLSDDALSCFINYTWPGNVRELINVLEQACLKKWKGEEITKTSLPDELTDPSPQQNLTLTRSGFKIGVRETERTLILNALNQTNGNKRKAASILRMPRSTLYKKLKEHDIDI